MLALALGALATLRASLQVSIMGIMTAITTTTIVITTKANPTGTTTAPTARRSTCIFEQMPVSELAVMVQGCRQLQSAWRGSWQRLGSSLNCVKQVLWCAGIFRSSRCVRGSVLLTTIRVPADVMRLQCSPAVRAGGKSLRRVAPFFLKNGS